MKPWLSESVFVRLLIGPLQAQGENALTWHSLFFSFMVCLVDTVEKLIFIGGGL